MEMNIVAIGFDHPNIPAIPVTNSEQLYVALNMMNMFVEGADAIIMTDSGAPVLFTSVDFSNGIQSACDNVKEFCYNAGRYNIVKYDADDYYGERLNPEIICDRKGYDEARKAACHRAVQDLNKAVREERFDIHICGMMDDEDKDVLVTIGDEGWFYAVEHNTTFSREEVDEFFN